MNCPYCETPSDTAEDLERIACCQKCQGDWMAGRGGAALFKDNLIYLPFAKHLAEEDAASFEKAA